MARLDCDLLPLLMGCATQTLAEKTVKMKNKAALCVVMAANGYPGKYQKNTIILGLDQAATLENTMIFHAGTVKDEKGRILANGGRVLGVTALGETVSQAQHNAYKAVDTIDWKEGFCRRDIGWRAIARETIA
jgi:phosphoribosylamine--glycine ligase